MLRIAARFLSASSLATLGAALALAAAPPWARAAEVRGGEYAYGSARSCAAAGKIPADLCANAEANAAAEFSEKAQRYPNRAACEQIFAQGCELGFEGADGWRGKRGAVYFTQRQQGFRIVVRSALDMAVAPVAQGLVFSQRPVLRRDTHVAFDGARRARDAYAGGSAAFGDSSPAGVRGPLPPPIALDPNFDCDSYLEPSARGGPAPKCYPAPGARR